MRNVGIGVIANFISVLFGSVIGNLLRHTIPDHLKEELPNGFGLCAITIGISSIIKLRSLTAVVLAVLMGYTIGILLKIDSRTVNSLQRLLQKKKIENTDMNLFATAITLFVFSGMGWYGAITEGISGNAEILLSKSVLDCFTAIVFGTALGWSICIIPLPQILVLFVMFLLGKLSSSIFTEAVFADFRAVGGIITLASGLRVAKIRQIETISLVPSLILIVPFSLLFAA